MGKIIIIGAGGYGRCIAETILMNGDYQIIGFVDDSTALNSTIMGYTVLGASENLARYKEVATHAVVAIGDNKIRERMFHNLESLGYTLPAIIHANASISQSAIIGRGSTIVAGAVIGPNASLGDGVVVNSGVVVDHDCYVGEFSYLGANATVTRNSTLEKCSVVLAGQLVSG